MSIEIEDPRRVLARHGFSPKRSFSQNFLVDRRAVTRIAEATRATAESVVVELGPGAGTLTTALLATGAKVVGVERDRDMAQVLRAELGGHERFSLLEGDAATVDLSAIAAEAGHELIVAGNLPYAITGAILRQLSNHRPVIERAVIMIQREVRDRLLAVPGTKAYGAASVFVQAGFAVEPVFTLAPGAFFPPPRVSSAVIRLERLATPRALETPALRETVHAIFESRRKTLRNSLRRIAAPDRVEAALAATGLDGGSRGETLSVERLADLAAALFAEP
jgi:16S rRNA (adenine1518-N6/adenine1519-N6)-dimethyltransferase